MRFSASPWRISGIAVLLFVVLSLVASGMNVQPPSYDVLLPVLRGFCERLREAEGTPAIWSRVAWAGAIMSPAAGTTSGSFIVGTALLRTGVFGRWLGWAAVSIGLAPDRRRQPRRSLVRIGQGCLLPEVTEAADELWPSALHIPDSRPRTFGI